MPILRSGIHSNDFVLEVIELLILRYLETQNCGPSCDNSSLFFVPLSGQLIVSLFCQVHGFLSNSYVLK